MLKPVPLTSDGETSYLCTSLSAGYLDIRESSQAHQASTMGGNSSNEAANGSLTFIWFKYHPERDFLENYLLFRTKIH